MIPKMKSLKDKHNAQREQDRKEALSRLKKKKSDKDEQKSRVKKGRTIKSNKKK